MKKIAISILVGLALLLAVSGASGQTGGPYDLGWNTVSSGGVTFSTGGTYSLGGTGAQPVASAPMNGVTFTLTGGFWAGVPPINVFVPLVRR